MLSLRSEILPVLSQIICIAAFDEVFLVGSFACGKADEFSDIDIVIIDDAIGHIAKETPIGLLDIKFKKSVPEMCYYQGFHLSALNLKTGEFLPGNPADIENFFNAKKHTAFIRQTKIRNHLIP